MLDGVRLDSVGADRLTLTAERDLDDVATGRFSSPSVGVRWSAINWPASIEFVAFGFTQFALPVTAGRAIDFEFRPAPGLRSPRAVTPLIARDRGGVVLLAPIDNPHEQMIAVGDDVLTWGWHGDLDVVPAGFSTTLGVYKGESVTEVLAGWRHDLGLDGPRRRSTNPIRTHLSYWSDNGAAYWYRTEPGLTIAESVAEAVVELRAEQVPVRAVELDSWFYSHSSLRPIDEIGYPSEVPPTGARMWEARPDAFPSPDDDGDPLVAFRERIDGAPLVLHARHIAPDSPYVTDEQEWWIDEAAAQPRNPAFFRRWFDDAVRWGATCIEQDWMLMYWFGVRALRAAPGRAAAWQRALDEHAGATGVDLLWCMATPADLIAASTFEHVAAVRTCDDYRFADDPAFLWTWFLTVNRLANTLGCAAFKDCFFSNPDVDADSDPIDGDRHAELEALLSALSGGPVGIGDRRGRTNRAVVMRTCDDDGRLRRVDRAVAAIDDCLFGSPSRGDGLMWATTTSTDADGAVWTYVVAVNIAGERRSISDRYEVGSSRMVLDWRTGIETITDSIAVELASRDWSFHVVAPSIDQRPSEVGDSSRYVVVEAAQP